MSRRLLGFTLALATAGFGMLGTPAANASCLVNLGTCTSTGNCTVNVNTCSGNCTVNAGACGTGCTILVNLGTCAPGANAVVVEGSGTIQPGIPCPGSGCTIHLDFTAAFTGQNATGTASCTFDGNDTFSDGMGGGATVLAGAGSGTINCSSGVTASGTVTFSRSGPVVDVGGNLTVNGTPNCVVDVTLAFAPTTTPPVTAFAVTGGGTVTC